MLTPLYSPLPIEVEKAEGISIYANGTVYMDAYAGIGVMAMGHSYKPSLKSLRAKSERYMHLCNYFEDPDSSKMAKRIVSLDGRSGSVAFSNSGAEATEGAIKAVKKLKSGKIISFKDNFHGRTCGALSITWGPAIRKPFEPLLKDVVFLPLDANCFSRFCDVNEISAVFVETVQGNSGVIPYPEDLLNAIKSKRDDAAYLIVCDEIQSGLGRTGKPFAYQHFDMEPDIVTMGKAIGGGVPLGAVAFYGVDPFKAGDHGSTFAPSPLALASGLPVLEALTPDFMEGVTEKGKRLKDGLSQLPWVNSVRGMGLMIGATTNDASAVRAKAFDNKVLLNIAGGAIRFLPALNITNAEIDELLNRLNFEI